MNVSEVKLVNFEKMVITDAQSKRDAILKELAEEKQEKLAIIDKELHEKAEQKFNKAKAKIFKEKNERIVQKQLIYKQEMLNERQGLIDNAFDNIKNRLDEFTNLQEYESYLIEKVKASKQKLEGASIAIISKNDEKYAQQISALGFTVEYTDDPIIGGCLVVDKDNGVRVDETFATKLQDVKDNFLETYNLKI